jgi:hypothetical protein
MWGDVLTGLLAVEGQAERTRTGGQARRRESLRLRKLLNSLRVTGGNKLVKENNNDEEYNDEELQNPG